MRIAFFSAAMLAFRLASAATPIDGLYGSLFGGYTYVPNHFNNTFIAPLYLGTSYNQISYNNGFNAGGRFGFQGTPMRYEAELTYLNATANITKRREWSLYPYWQPKIYGQANAAIGLANVYYDFPQVIPCIAPFLGLGIGFGWVESSLSSQSLLYRYRTTGSGGAFAYQGTAGLSYNFSESYSLTLAYRYVGTTKINGLRENFSAHLASVGVVYRFNEYYYK